LFIGKFIRSHGSVIVATGQGGFQVHAESTSEQVAAKIIIV